MEIIGVRSQIRRSCPLLLSSDTTMGAGQTRYFAYGGLTAAAGTFAAVIPADGVLRYLYVNANVAPGAGDTFTYTILINSVATTLTCQIAGAAAVACSDLVNTVNVAAGDIIEIRVVSSATAAGACHRASVMLLY